MCTKCCKCALVANTCEFTHYIGHPTTCKWAVMHVNVVLVTTQLQVVNLQHTPCEFMHSVLLSSSCDVADEIRLIYLLED